ncbi:MAG TPA: substrate-binding domain-containing protein [Bacteroidota bacterium]|nr:substrate-binding domain-containing protein [Bacteroidota bacterium]
MIPRLLRIREFVIFLAVLLTAAGFSLMQPGGAGRFVSFANLEAVLLGMSLDSLVAIGMTFVIITGGFDLAVGSTFAFGGLIVGLLLQSGWGVIPAIGASVLAGVGIGLFNGLVITKVRVNPFVTTLGSMTIIRGIVLLATQGASITGFPPGFALLGQGKVAGIFYPVIIMLVFLVIADVLLRKSRFLRQVYYVGGNEEAAKLSGINVDRVRIWMYVFTGALSALSGVIAAAKTGSASPIAGSGAELRIIAAVVVGGASLSGGKGTIFGTFLGLLLTSIITSGLGFLRISFYAEGIVSGTILIIAVMLDQLTRERARRVLMLLTTTRSKRMERGLNVVLVVAVAALLIFRPWGSPSGKETAAGTSPSADEVYVFIGVSVGNPYWVDSRHGLEDKARLLGVLSDLRGPTGSDPNMQVAEFEQVLARRPAGILIAPASDALRPMINRAVESGVPVICVDTDDPGSKRYTYIGTDNYNAGFRTGELLAKAVGGKGEVALLMIPGQSNLEGRARGCRDALARYPGITIVKTGNDQALSAEAEKVARSILQAYPDLAGFACVDAAGGEGCAVAVNEVGKGGAVKIIAMDKNETTLQYVREGLIEASIAQRTYTMAYMGVQLLYDLRHNNIRLVDNWREAGIVPLPNSIDTGTLVITKANVKTFLQGGKKP